MFVYNFEWGIILNVLYFPLILTTEKRSIIMIWEIFLLFQKCYSFLTNLKNIQSLIFLKYNFHKLYSDHNFFSPFSSQILPSSPPFQLNSFLHGEQATKYKTIKNKTKLNRKKNKKMHEKHINIHIQTYTYKHKHILMHTYKTQNGKPE